VEVPLVSIQPVKRPVVIVSKSGVLLGRLLTFGQLIKIFFHLIGHEGWLLMASLVAVDYKHEYIFDMWIVFVLRVLLFDVKILLDNLLESKLEFLKTSVVLLRAKLKVLR
jgi:hypothetical protein